MRRTSRIMVLPMNTQTQVTALGVRLSTTIRWSLSRCASFVLDLVYPTTCAGCGIAGEGVGVWCAACNAQVLPLAGADLFMMLALNDPYQGQTFTVFSAARYESPLKNAIHRFKYEGTPSLATPLSQHLLRAWQDGKLCADVLVPVPLHPRRQRERGYNQSELLARNLGVQTGVPVEPDLLRRVRHTQQQARLSGQERRRNVQGAFVATPGASGKAIVIVDDVLTTGATLLECATALTGAGASNVCALTLARADS